MKKTIVHIAECAGGVDRYIRMLIKYLNDYDHVLFCSQQYKTDDYKDIVSSIEVIEMENDISLLDFSTIFKIRKQLKCYKPDLVYCHSSKAGGLGRLASIGMNAKVIYNPHGWAFSMNKGVFKKALYATIERLLSLFTDRIITISEYERKLALSKVICQEKKVTTILNGIDFDEIDSDVRCSCVTRNSLGIKEDAYVVGMVGRISEQKAPDVFVRMASLVKKAIPNAFFVIVGGGYLKKQVEELIKIENLQKDFLITGWVENPYSYAQLFDQAVLLSRWEGFGLVLTEYMYMNKPIVATNVDAIPEIVVNGKIGLLVEKNNEEQAADAIISIYRDQALRQSLVSCAKSTVLEKYNIVRVAEQHKQLFNAIL